MGRIDVVASFGNDSAISRHEQNVHVSRSRDGLPERLIEPPRNEEFAVSLVSALASDAAATRSTRLDWNGRLATSRSPVKRCAGGQSDETGGQKSLPREGAKMGVRIFR